LLATGPVGASLLAIAPVGPSLLATGPGRPSSLASGLSPASWLLQNPHVTTLPPALLADLRAALGDALRLDPAERLTYGFDNSRRHALPDAVALPVDAAQVVAIVQACRRHCVPVISRGRGTNTTGASVPVDGGVVVSFERMDRILAIRPGDRTAVVQPGVLNGDLQRALAPHGLFWPPDPTSAAYSTVGGNLACNAGGPRAVKYGATRDNVLSLVAVTGTGDVVRCGAPTTKGATGYDLSRVLIGSEGTLAVIVEATLRLVPTAARRRVLRALYADVDSAAAAVARLMAQPVTPSMLEFMDGACVGLVRSAGVALPPDTGALLLIEADGDGAALDADIGTLARVASGDGCLGVEAAADDAGREALWAARKSLSPALRTLAPGKINEDVVVPVSRIPDLVARVGAIARDAALPIVCFGHAGNGNLHVNILYDPADDAQQARADAALAQVFDAVIALDGQLSGEHGIGLAKRPFMAKAIDAPTLALMRGFKRLFDPDGILNPRKVLPEPAKTRDA
jgi:D-lactate dehydrogenase